MIKEGFEENELIVNPHSAVLQGKCDDCNILFKQNFYASKDDEFDKFLELKVSDIITIFCPKCNKKIEIQINEINHQFRSIY